MTIKFNGDILKMSAGNKGSRTIWRYIMSKYYRCSNDNNPMSDWGHAMFCDNFEMVDHYGKNIFTFDGTDAIDIKELKDTIISTWEECIEEDSFNQAENNGADMEYFKRLSGEEVFESLNPDEIVNSAEAYDSDLGIWFYWYIAEPKDIKAVLTNNGAIVYDESLIIFEGVQE